MALNPNLSRSEPVVGSEELFLIRRDRVNFRVSETSKPSKIGVFKGVGSLYLTTESMFFVADVPKAQGPHKLRFESFRIPLIKMTREKFNQPIFGANNLTGRVAPACDANTLEQLNGLNDFKFCFTFTNGGCGTFLPIFFRIMGEVRRYGEEAAHHVAEQVLSGTFTGAAYIDPSDPSTIYVSQPQRHTVDELPAEGTVSATETRGPTSPSSDVRRPAAPRMSAPALGLGTHSSGVDAGTYLV